MAQLTCPHCQSIFQLDLSTAAHEFACPDCGGTVMSPSAPPVRPAARDLQQFPRPAAAAPLQVIPVEPIAPPPSAEPVPPPEIDQPQGATTTFDPPASDPPAPAAALATGIDPSEEEGDWNRRALRHYSSEEKASKRFVKNVIVWVVCAICMILLMLFFLKR